MEQLSVNGVSKRRCWCSNYRKDSADQNASEALGKGQARQERTINHGRARSRAFLGSREKQQRRRPDEGGQASGGRRETPRR